MTLALTRHAAVAAVVCVCAVAACSKENTVNIAGQAGTAVTPALPDCTDAGASPASKGSPMGTVGNLSGECFWIDLREVTNEDYGVFVASGFQLADPRCMWNTSPDPACDLPATDGGAPDPMLPARCVNWCDALAYCTWAGKTLCRGDISNPADAALSDWYSVCSHGQVNEMPYGAYQAGLCNGSDKGAGAPLRADDLPQCTTAEGVLNLSGNVAEWVDECTGAQGAAAECNTRGGSYASAYAAMRCSEAQKFPRNARHGWVGFRCCAYPP